MMQTSIITPQITDNCNMRISQQSDDMINVRLTPFGTDDNNYIIMFKNGEIKDITIDEKTVELLVKSYSVKTRIKKVVEYAQTKFKRQITQTEINRLLSDISSISDNPSDETLDYYISEKFGNLSNP